MKKFLLLQFLLVSSIFTHAQIMNESQGSGSGASITTGDYNTFYGDSSGFQTTSGLYNVSMGYRAGFNITTGSEGVYIGYEAGFSDDNALDNMMIGFRAGYYNTASDNTFIGNAAGFNNTTGVDNTFLGEKAGARVTTGEDNTFIGCQAGTPPTTGFSSVTGPTTNPLTGSDNTAIGSSAGSFITTGYRNVFVGSEAGYDNTTGYWNTCVGDSAGTDNSDGMANTMIGHGAGAVTEHASHNTFVGNYAGFDNNRTNATSGEGFFNTYLGSSAGYRNREGNGNIAIGYRADFLGNAQLGSKNQNNIAIGREALIGAPSVSEGIDEIITIGAYSRVDRDQSIAIGTQTRVSGLRSVAIGYNADIGLNLNDNTVIGYQPGILGRRNAVFGSGTNALDNDATVFGYAASADSLSTAIGSGASATGINSAAIGFGASTSQSNAMVLGGATEETRVSVGIATNAPNSNASLDLADTTKGFLMNRLTTPLRTTLGSSLTNADEGLMVYDTDSSAIYFWDGADWAKMGEGGGTSGDDLGNHIASENLQLNGNWISSDGDNEGLFVAADGRVGLGTDAPGYYLDIVAPGQNTVFSRMAHTGTSSGLIFGVNASNQVRFNQTENADLQFLTQSQNRMVIKGSGNVGIGTLSPVYQLDVIGSIRMVDGNEQNGYVALSGPDGRMIWSDPTPFLDNTDAQNLTLTGSLLSIDNGNSVDLSSIDTDTQLNEAQVDAFVANNGYLTTFTEVDGDVTNEIQDISLSGSDLTISSGSTIDLSGIDTDTQLNEAQVDAFVANNGYLTTFTEVDGDVTNEIQDISLSGSDLTISSGSTIDLSTIDTNTDEQDLLAATLTGTTLQIDIENGASVSVDLAPLLSNLQNQVNNIQTQVDDHETRIVYLEDCACDSTAGLWDNQGSGFDEEPILYQNIPNPFNGTSSIKYYVPSYASSANIIISNSLGQLVHTFDLHEVGNYGEVLFNADGLATGTYYYTMYVNQTKFDTKSMLIE